MSQDKEAQLYNGAFKETDGIKNTFLPNYATNLFLGVLECHWQSHRVMDVGFGTYLFRQALVTAAKLQKVVPIWEKRRERDFIFPLYSRTTLCLISTHFLLNEMIMT